MVDLFLEILEITFFQDIPYKWPVFVSVIFSSKISIFPWGHFFENFLNIFEIILCATDDPYKPNVLSTLIAFLTLKIIPYKRNI